MMANFQQEAINKLGMMAPELVSLIVSFRDVSDELPEGSDSSAGVFVVKMGDSMYFIPITGTGDSIHPIDSIYDAVEGLFKPLSKTAIQQILTQQNNALGRPVRLPKHVNTNPSLYNLIVPPRTGKYAYASQGLFSEFIASMPDHLKEGFKTSVLGDNNTVTNLSKVINMAELMDSLAHSNPVTPTLTASTPEVQIYTGADAGKGELADHVIQDILNVGYHIQGDNVTPRVAMETPRGTEGFSQLRGVEEGRAYEIVLKDGSTVKAMVPKQMRVAYRADLDGDYVSVGMAVSTKKQRLAGRTLAVTEYGDWIDDQNTIVRPNPLDISEVASELYALSKINTIDNVENNDKFVVLTNRGMLGPFEARNVSSTGSMTSIMATEVWGDCDRVCITASAAFKGEVFCEGSNVYLPLHANVVALGSNVNMDVENSLSSAVAREELKTLGLLQSEMTIRGHDNGFFSINGRSVGSEADLVKMLMVGEGIGKEASLGFIKSAKERKSVTVYMSKKADDMGAITPGDIPEYGQMPTPEDPNLFTPSDVEEATHTMDPGIIESTIMTQFLQDPSMIDTIAGYLPYIKDSIDKIGRSLLLLRLNSGVTLPDDVSALITSLRNTYKMLGENCIKLEYMINGSSQ